MGNDQAAFGLSVVDWNRLQARMVPEGMSLRDVILLVGEAGDPCACPERNGSSLSVDAESQLQSMTNIVETVVDSMNNFTEAQNEQAGRGRQKWTQAVQNKAFDEAVRDPVKLGQLILDFDETWPYEKENQDLSFRAHLSRLGYSEAFVNQWLETGLLPVMIRQTCVWHRAMLQAIYSDYLQYPAIPWDEGHPSRVALHGFCKTVAFYRRVSHYKANFVVKVYIYYRDQQRQNFGRHRLALSFMHTLQHQIYSLPARGGGNAGANADSGAGTPKFCAHCSGSSTVHVTSACPYHQIPKAAVKKVFGNMNGTQRKGVYRVFKRLDSENPDGNQLEHLEKAIKEIRSSPS